MLLRHCPSTKLGRQAPAMPCSDVSLHDSILFLTLSWNLAMATVGSPPGLESGGELLTPCMCWQGRLKAGSKGLPSLKATACGYLAGAEANSIASLDSDSAAAVEAHVAGIPQVGQLCRKPLEPI